MSYGADILVIFASLGAMAYCMVLSRRLSRLTSFDKGLGGAIAVMSSQVDEMKAALKEVKSGSDGAGTQLSDLVFQAKEISSELEMMIAACHDFAEEAITVQTLKADENDALSDEITEDELGLSESPEDSVTPIFGTRRANPGGGEDPVATAAPLFGRRKSVAG